MVLMAVACFALSLASIPAAADDSYRITVRVVGALADQGQIIGSLFDSPETYMQDSVTELAAPVGPEGEVVLDFGVHAPGYFAVAVVYDVNSNGELDTGFMRIPKEKIGFSNNARHRFGPAKWKAARFELVDSDIELLIQLEHSRDIEYSQDPSED
jgi:uncharacterized protein (DUF2141 family)